MDLVREKGLFSFYEDGHGECCRIRKVRALRLEGGCRCWAVAAPAAAGGLLCPLLLRAGQACS